MQIVNHCTFKKLTLSLLFIIFPFHVYFATYLALLVKKTIKPDKTPKNPPGLGFKNGFSEPWI